MAYCSRATATTLKGALLTCHYQGISGKYKQEAQQSRGPMLTWRYQRRRLACLLLYLSLQQGHRAHIAVPQPDRATWDRHLELPAPESVGTGYVTFYWNKIKPISFCQQALTSWRVERLWDSIDLTNTVLLVNLHLFFSFLSLTVLSTTGFLRGYIPISDPTYEISNSNLLGSPI